MASSILSTLSRYPYHFYTDVSMVLDVPFSNSSPIIQALLRTIKLLPIFKPILLPRASSPASATENFKSCFGSPSKRLWFCTPNQAPTIIQLLSKKPTQSLLRYSRSKTGGLRHPQKLEVFAGDCNDCPRMLASWELVLVYILQTNIMPSGECGVLFECACIIHACSPIRVPSQN